MHQCFANPEAMRFWNTLVHAKRIETERAVRRFIDCTPSYYRFWAVADAATDGCLGMVNYHDGHVQPSLTSCCAAWARKERPCVRPRREEADLAPGRAGPVKRFA